MSSSTGLVNVYDQSFCRKTIERVLSKRDFRRVPIAQHAAHREFLVHAAAASAASRFGGSPVPLRPFRLRGKLVYVLAKPQDRLVVRKLHQNLKRCVPGAVEGRSQIVSNLRLLLAEGVPYRVYRLDIRSFYESFDKREVMTALRLLRDLSPQSKSLIETLLASHTALDGQGIPRGISLSAVLSDLLMQRFDHVMRSAHDTFYYSRYVDDIIIVTSAREKAIQFIRLVQRSLPAGLHLNPDKKSIVEAITKVTKASKSGGSHILSFDYLGYAFSVSNPAAGAAGSKRDGELQRSVSIDIAERKLKKLKTRIVRALLEFSHTGDWTLLRDRFAFLTQNFSVYNLKAGGKKLAGIYHSYPLVTVGSSGLLELDRFLRNAVLARSGRVFSKSAPLLTGNQKRELLKYSFERGHANRSFVHFSGQRISEIQRCWAN